MTKKFESPTVLSKEGIPKSVKKGQNKGTQSESMQSQVSDYFDAMHFLKYELQLRKGNNSLLGK